MNKPRPDFETYLTTPIDPHLDSMIRFHYALVLQLRDMYNFKYEQQLLPLLCIVIFHETMPN